jgi:hypothetical protein
MFHSRVQLGFFFIRMGTQSMNARSNLILIEPTLIFRPIYINQSLRLSSEFEFPTIC